MEVIASNGQIINSGDKVLVRNKDDDWWIASIFSCKENNDYICINIGYNQCIPFEGNKELCGTSNKEKQVYNFGDKVRVLLNKDTCDESIVDGYIIEFYPGNKTTYQIVFKEVYENMTGYSYDIADIKENNIIEKL